MARKEKNNDFANPDLLNRIVDGADLEGNIVMKSSLRMDGILRGTLDCKGKLVLGKTGLIEGNIACADADVEGTISGDLIVAGVLYLRSTAKITGTIKTQKIVIENGAEFNGTCEMSEKVEATVEKKVIAEKDDSEMVY